MKTILNIVTAIAFSTIGLIAFGAIVAAVGYEGAFIFIGVVVLVLLTIIINLLIKIKDNLEKLNR